MVKPLIGTIKKTSFIIVITTLAIIIAILLVLLYSILTDIGQVNQESRQYLITLACLVAGVLLLNIFLLVVEILHYAGSKVSSRNLPIQRTEHIEEDAWTEAGKRLKPEDAPPIDDFEQDEG